MKILYLWIKEYKNIHNQGFNFSNQYDINFDHVLNKLFINKNPNFIKNLFGGFFSNVTAVVGENGAGKSNLLDFTDFSLCLFFENGQYYLSTTLSENIEVVGESEIIDSLVYQDDYRSKESLLIRYSNYFDGYKRERIRQEPFESANCYDLTTDSLVLRHEYGNTFDEDLNIYTEKYRYSFTEMSEQINFVLTFHELEIPFQLPEKIEISFVLSDEYAFFKKQIYEHERMRDNLNSDEGKNYSKSVADLLRKLESNFIKNFTALNKELITEPTNSSIMSRMAIFQLEWTMLFSFLNSYEPPRASDETYISFKDFNEKWDSKPIETWFKTYFGDYLRNYVKEYAGSKFNKQMLAWCDHAISFVESFQSLMPLGEVVYDGWLGGKINAEKSVSEALKGIKFIIDITNKNAYQRFKAVLVDLYGKITEPENFRIDTVPFLRFQWRAISTGEKAYLRLFSRLYALIEAIRRRPIVQSPIYNNATIKSLFIIIDEGEIGMHPQWQKAYFNTLIKSIPILYANSTITSVQLVLATHSPFVVSDLPISNILFLNKDAKGDCQVVRKPFAEKKPTFASNIHTLFADSFFMREGLFGDFAKEKIDQVIDILLSKDSFLDEEQKDYVKGIINAIGEPIIRKKMMQLFNDKVNFNVDDRIVALEYQLAELRKSRNSNDTN